MVHLRHQFFPVRNNVPGQRRIAMLGWFLVALIAGYSIFIRYSWTQSPQWQHWFWQGHTLVFAGTILILAITLLRLPAWQSRRFYVVCGALIAAHILTIIASWVGIWWYDSTVGGPLLSWNFAFYLFIYTTHTFALAYGVPLGSFPRIRVVQLATETLLVFVLTDVVLRVLLPNVIPSWLWTPGTQALELRLVNSVGVSFWYIRVYRQFAAFRGRFVTLWGLGLLAMLGTDVLFLLGTLFSLHNGYGGPFAYAMPLWDLHQVLWAWGLFWASQTPLQWRTDVERPNPTSKPVWWIVGRQSFLLAVLVLISSGIVSSPLSLVWLICALVMHEAIGMYEREQLIAIRERTRIARELHDGVCRSLNLVRVQLAVCEHLVSRDPQCAVQELVTAQRMVADGQAEARQTILALRDTSTLTQPLPILIEPLIDELHEVNITVIPTVLGNPRVFHPHITWELFRVIQEALTNVRKHAAATTVEIVLDYESRARFRVTIRDNGCGAGDPEYGTGLFGMRERVHLSGGTFDIVTAPQQGFMINVEVPL